MTRIPLRLLIVPIAVSWTGCGDLPPTGAGAGIPAAPVSAVSAAPVDRPDEAEMAALARAVPGLGGYYLAGDGALVVHLTDLAQARAATEALLPVARRQNPGGVPVRARQARFTFLELQAWRDQLSDPLLSLDEVAFVDLDEGQNRVTVGVTRDEARGRVVALAVERGVPPEAVHVVRGAPGVSQDTVVYGAYLYTWPEQGETLNSYRRPLMGGLQLGFRKAGMDPNTYTFCTLGFSARLNGYRVVITNTHCSKSTWDRDDTSYFQAEPGDGRYVGYELRDPNGESCGFMSLNVCRNADASAVYVEVGVRDSLGYIARPVGPPAIGRSQYGTLAGSRVVDAANPVFPITGRASVTQGAPAHKVGASTGWTRGDVDRTCVDVKVKYRTYSVMRCQKFATYSSTGGDSGAPVFALQPDGTVLLLGIHWGETDDRAFAIFSSLAQVEADLGTLSITGTSGGTGGTGGGDDGGTPPPPGDGGPVGGCRGECVT